MSNERDEKVTDIDLIDAALLEEVLKEDYVINDAVAIAMVNIRIKKAIEVIEGFSLNTDTAKANLLVAIVNLYKQESDELWNETERPEIVEEE
jgi:hypothetical protein